MSRPIVAIVGRPNVGKSTLFNRLAGKRISIVEDTPGVTRDRIYAPCDWNGREVLLIDTGGIEPYSQETMLVQMRKQAEIAIESADAIIFVVDLQTGITASDIEVAAMLQKSGKPITLCVNKSDSIGNIKPEFYEFYNLGLGDPISVSSVHGHGTGDLLDAVFASLEFSDDTDYAETDIQVAIIGKPNVGKSSLVNQLSGEDRAVVTDIAGTTRDATDTIVERDDNRYIFIDTAGIRRKSKIEEKSIERYSVIRSFSAVDRANVCLIMIDATEGFTEQDSKIAGYAHDQGKASVVVVNKWDLIEKGSITKSEYEKKLKARFAFMSYAPFVFISAKTGYGLGNMFQLLHYVYEQNNMRISTGKLNNMLAIAVARVQPPTDKGVALKIFYMTQATTAPPTFVCFVNSEKLFHFSYQRYIENQIRETFGLEGTPIRIIVRERG